MMDEFELEHLDDLARHILDHSREREPRRDQRG